MKLPWVHAIVMSALSPAAAQAQEYRTGSRTQSGTFGNSTYTAKSTVVGQTSTATVAGGGSSRYLAQGANYNGVVGLVMEFTGGAQFVCSGSLLGDRRSIATAAHCVSDGMGTRSADLVKTTAYFFDGTQTYDPYIYNQPAGVTTSDISNYFVNSAYTGEVIDQNDIAVLTLADFAPAYAKSYELYDGGDLTGRQFNVAGYGTRSTPRGATRTDSDPPPGVGRRRQGDNVYDFRLGDDDFDGFFTDKRYFDPIYREPGRFFGMADVAYTYLADFDNGLGANDASCLVAGALDLGGSKYCNLGLGDGEVGIAGGDSGGPGFIDGKLASINSFGLTFNTQFGDYDGRLDSSWGEFNGYVPTSIHRDFILSSMLSAVPEPATWVQLLLGFGMLAAGIRRRVAASVTPAA